MFCGFGFFKSYERSCPLQTSHPNKEKTVLRGGFFFFSTKKLSEPKSLQKVRLCHKLPKGRNLNCKEAPLMKTS